MREEPRKRRAEILINAKPPFAQTLCRHVAAKRGDRRNVRKEFAGLHTTDDCGKSRTAIAWTNAGVVVAVIRWSRRHAATALLKTGKTSQLAALMATRR